MKEVFFSFNCRNLSSLIEYFQMKLDIYWKLALFFQEFNPKI